MFPIRAVRPDQAIRESHHIRLGDLTNAMNVLIDAAIGGIGKIVVYYVHDVFDIQTTSRNTSGY